MSGASIDRRAVLKHGSVIAAASVLPQRVMADDANQQRFEDRFDEITQALVSHFAGQGYTEFEAAPLVTGEHEVNGGLRGDVVATTQAPGRYMIQHCTRIDDIDVKDRADILPYFHIFACQGHDGTASADMFAEMLRCLTTTIGLDPNRMVFVSVPDFEELRPAVEAAGLSWENQVVIRDPDSARAAGDGSGIWQRAGGGISLVVPTVGIHYRIGELAAETPVTYPLPSEWTELGEFSLDNRFLPTFVLGAERLVLANGGGYPSWNDRLGPLLRRIEVEGEGAMPPGYDRFKSA